MAKFTSLSAKFIIRDERIPCIYYRNKKWSLGITLSDPKEFDVKTGKLTHHYRGLDKEAVNTTIQKRYQLINRLITEALEQGKDSLTYINSYLTQEEEKLTKLAIDTNTTISEAYQDWIEAKKSELTNKHSKERYDSELARLLDFEKTNKTLLGGIDLKWIKRLALYLSKPYEKTYEIVDELNEREYTQTKTLVQTNSTIQRFLFDLIAFLRSVQKEQGAFIFPLSEFRKYAISLKVAHDDIENITVLSRTQWQDIKAFREHEKFDWAVRTMDLFRFCVCTGLRYSDAINLNDDYVKNNVITMKAQKTRNKFEVPMNDLALEIYNKYDKDFRNKFPKNQQINKNLRKILKKIPSCTDTIIDYVYVLDKITEVKKPFYEKLSFHDSRKSFVSFIILNNKGGDVLAKIQRFTGWTDIRTLKHYLNVFGSDNKLNDFETVQNF